MGEEREKKESTEWGEGTGDKEEISKRKKRVSRQPSTAISEWCQKKG